MDYVDIYGTGEFVVEINFLKLFFLKKKSYEAFIEKKIKLIGRGWIQPIEIVDLINVIF